MRERTKSIFKAAADILLKVLPLVISVIALWNTMLLNKKFIEPNVGTKMEFLSRQIPNGFMEDKTRPEFNVYNAGPVKVVSLSVDHLLSDVNVNTSKIEASQMPGIEDVGSHFLFEKELNVFDVKKKISEQLYDRDNTVRVCIFDLQYFRESDMKKYSRRDIYFVDNNQIFFSKNYRDINRDKYNSVMKVIGDIDKYKAYVMTHTPRQIRTLIVVE